MWLNVKLGRTSQREIGRYWRSASLKSGVPANANTKDDGSGHAGGSDKFEGKYRMRSRCGIGPALSCNADIQTNEVKDVVEVPMQGRKPLGRVRAI